MTTCFLTILIIHGNYQLAIPPDGASFQAPTTYIPQAPEMVHRFLTLDSTSRKGEDRRSLRAWSSNGLDTTDEYDLDDLGRQDIVWAWTNNMQPYSFMLQSMQHLQSNKFNHC